MSYSQRMKESLLQVLETIYREHPDEFVKKYEPELVYYIKALYYFGISKRDKDRLTRDDLWELFGLLVHCCSPAVSPSPYIAVKHLRGKAEEAVKEDVTRALAVIENTLKEENSQNVEDDENKDGDQW
ncbi:hypothetical protein OTK01_000346 [Caldicellulosiruptor acetigenus]|uniref:hypothetical protein n=1 Tax=Caldicellulosiruptor acetigenus TaxID=301953 RepID=UPI0022A9A67C|nr:hypothetical protein [Caldicellulosiruptor acetigenus]WAM36572.1 hypothetical protein OTK01_000346 [Caldicellulosiruptor acetigenus]